jgi:hypothetical protein
MAQIDEPLLDREGAGELVSAFVPRLVHQRVLEPTEDLWQCPSPVNREKERRVEQTLDRRSWKAEHHSAGPG